MVVLVVVMVALEVVVVMMVMIIMTNLMIMILFKVTDKEIDTSLSNHKKMHGRHTSCTCCSL